ncbi:MAG TPA: RNA polymerase subunit sigma [Chloroflexi bacterium]|nr:RNA polymerase subunit sigma [Chloroflexota bacterium]
MDSTKLSASIQKAARLILNAKYMVALTGAGSSTPSGIPDFRSTGSGLWTRYLPTEVASLSSFNQSPERFFEWLRPLASHMLTAQPNAAHYALALFEKHNYLKTLITQNIDGLHQRAGSNNVLQVHGTLNTLTCVGCYQQFDGEPYTRPYLEQGIIPHCEFCGNYLKPDVVLFEEQLPAKIWLKARQAVETCDLLLIAGTSLLVSPVAQLPERALKNKAGIIIINQSPTYLDALADLLFPGDVAEIIPAIAAEVMHD